ncbi:MAG: FtsX-like permease family protein, partial [bacterium]
LGEQFWPSGHNWSNFIHETYVQLQSHADPRQAGEKITAVLLKNFPQISPYLKRLYLQPLADIHLDAEVTGSDAVLGDKKYVYLFSLVAGFVLLIACINFMNLATARSLQRAKEVGMRRVAGASRWQLVGQFYGESILLAFIALFLALLLVELFLPAFNQLSGKNLAMDYRDPRLVLGFTVIILATGLVAGSYPALYLSSFKPVKVLKGMMESGTQGSRFRKALVVTQFSLSVILMIGAAVVYQQLEYMRNKKLGFEKENLVYVPAKENAGAKYEAFKNELLQEPNIIGVTAQGSLPMFSVNSGTVSWEGKDPSIEQVMENKAVDINFVELMNLKILEGRNFSTAHPSDAKEAFIINEEAARIMGMDSAVGKRITTAGRKGTIIGVVQNAHFKSLHHKIQPQFFYVLTNFTSEVMNLYGIVLIKIKSTDIPKTIAAIENVWKRVNPNTPFEYHFLDETIDRQYAAEKKISAMANYFTILAIAISCLGLFGLAAFAAERRTKEIGVRKVLGATVTNIVSMLSQDFVKLVLVANIIAWPVAYFAMNKWLQNFAYRIDLGWWVFVFAGGAALLIALLTVSTQALKAALANPVDSSRYE